MLKKCVFPLVRYEKCDKVSKAYFYANTNIVVKHRYKIHINVNEIVGKTTLVLFNGVAEKFLHTFSSMLVNRLSKSYNHVPSQIDIMCGKEFVFKLILRNYKLNEGLENYTVTKVYVLNEELKLQHRINKDKKVMYV